MIGIDPPSQAMQRERMPIMLNEHLTDVLWDVPKTALGFFIALTLHRLVGIVADKKAFHSMLRAIRSEAKANQAILSESFLKKYEDGRLQYKEGIVLREFSTETLMEHLKDTLFLEHAKPALVDFLHQYARDIKLANSYRAKAEEWRIKPPKGEWLDSLIEAWGINLEKCGNDIEKVLRLRGRASGWEKLIGNLAATDGADD